MATERLVYKRKRQTFPNVLLTEESDILKATYCLKLKMCSVPIVLNGNYGGFCLSEGAKRFFPELGCEEQNSIKVRTDRSLVEFVSDPAYKGDLYIEQIPKEIFDATMIFHTPSCSVSNTRFFRVGDYDGCESLELHTETFASFKDRQDADRIMQKIKGILLSKEVTDGEKLNQIAEICFTDSSSDESSED